jgi:SecD/SecF fusion protein
MSLKWKIICTAIALVFSAIFIYPTLRWVSLSPERREQLTNQWESEEPLPRGSMRQYARAIRRWAQGDRERVLNLGLDLEGGVHLLYEMQFPTEMDARMRAQIASSQVEIIRNRVDELGIREPIIQREGDRRILIQMPGVKDAARAEELVGKPAQLKFHIVEGQDSTRKVLDNIDRTLNGRLWPRLRHGEEGGKFVVREADMHIVRSLLEEARELWPQGYVFAFETSPPAFERDRFVGLYLIREEEEMTGETLTNATSGANMDSAAGGFQVNLQFNARGAARFATVTKEHVGEQLGAVIDGRVQCAPTIQEAILGGRARITGQFSDREAQDLAIALRSGALPVEMKKIEERTVGPTLGAQSIQKGIRAGLIGLAIVIVFMIAYYRLAGVIADVALLLNILLIMSVLACLGATLTLPGIAGIILTMGMAVDANVLIFERIREELRKGKTIRAAIETGYSRAFLTIIDANVTTLIAALVLFQFGTGPVKGFAVTLSIGIFASVFTAIVVTRMVFDILTKKRTFRTLTMMSFVGDTAFSFIAKRRFAFAASLAVILLGMGFFVARGSGNFGIDFVPGSIVQMTFDDEVTTGQVRNVLLRSGIENAVIQSVEGTRDILIRTSETGTTGSQSEEPAGGSVDKRIVQALEADASLPSFTIEKEEFVGPAVGSELKKDAVLAMFIAIAGIIVYISFRFELRFALAAVVALFHDVLVTTGCFALPFLGKREISLPVVAALLTIVGYSLNDTIVVFDRIRENMKTLRGKRYADIIDISINQTLSRTLLTSLTTLVVVVSLYVLGGVVIHDFAFAMLVGVIVGTYSSIFVASPLLVAWYRRRRA